MAFVFAYPPGVDDEFVTNMCLHLRPPYYLQQPSLEDPPTLPKAMSPGQSLKMPGDELGMEVLPVLSSEDKALIDVSSAPCTSLLSLRQLVPEQPPDGGLIEVDAAILAARSQV